MMTSQRLGTFLIAACLLLLAGCAREESAGLKETAVQAPPRTARVERRTPVIEIAGTVRATDVAQLASRFGGFITALPAKAGMRVKKGELLVLLDDRNLAAQQQKVLAGKKEAQKIAEAADAQRRLATNTFERIAILYQKQSASQQEFEEAQSRKEAAEASYQSALERIAQAESDARDVRASSDYLRIVAPFDGTITNVSADAGTFVNSGHVIVSMENRSAYQVLFSVEEDLLSSIEVGKHIPVSIPVISTERCMATVEEVNTATDAGTRTFLVKANLPVNAEIRSGLSARIFLQSATGARLVIPEAFLRSHNDVETVLAKDNGSWRRVLVKSGNHENGMTEILSGLNEGDIVGLAGENR
jgi:RND family efflux transporter MFP subunit